jgi:hypothetical protein
MADDDKTEAGPAAPARRTQRAQATASADEAPVQRPIPAPRTLTRTELETLRSRLQRKFH